jgi:DUF4097 and DUF4098 domain-containing protein YvlB
MNTTQNTRLSYASFAVILLFSVLLPGQPLVASEFNQNAIRLVHFDIDQANSTSLKVSSSNGDITITGVDTDRVVVDAEITVNGRKIEECEELAKRVHFENTRIGSKIILDPNLPRKIGYGISISYTILIPTRLNVDLETANGELSVADCQGDLSAEATNGSISADKISGNVSVASVNGSIFLSNLISNQISAETVNGIIDCQCVSKAPQKIDISTVNGSIQVTLPKDANAALSADAVNGGLNISTGQGQITSKTRGSIEMTIGEGLGRYELSCVNGSIEVLVSNPPD